ncbi:hypothetical protein RRG08_048301 [Elysia crispata]|uniref:Uncharacterized protein n=1 Tax=Elysia crispata TaxID=231223 RepID=A0AAE0ZUC3_9GAST|nr:hypothetical protein RRG08_048301 [Elysia crispata]
MEEQEHQTYGNNWNNTSVTKDQSQKLECGKTSGAMTKRVTVFCLSRSCFLFSHQFFVCMPVSADIMMVQDDFVQACPVYTA